MVRQLARQIPGAKSAYIALHKRVSKPEWYFGRRRWLSALRMRPYHNCHAGQRCFIIGNGPSLNQMDLSPLKHEITFGMNRIYILFEKLGWQTTYFACVNPTVVDQYGRDIEQLPMPKFIGWHARNMMRFTESTILLAPDIKRPYFSPNPVHTLWEGATVTYAAMQIAYYMGFSEVILIGVDHNFVDKGDPHKLVVTESHDANHFDPNYFGKGVRWNLPDLETSEIAYTLARDHYAANGRRILDATVGGKLQVFPKVDFASLWG